VDILIYLFFRHTFINSLPIRNNNRFNPKEHLGHYFCDVNENSFA